MAALTSGISPSFGPFCWKRKSVSRDTDCQSALDSQSHSRRAIGQDSERSSASVETRSMSHVTFAQVTALTCHPPKLRPRFVSHPSMVPVCGAGAVSATTSELKKAQTAARSRSGMLIKICRYFSSTAYVRIASASWHMSRLADLHTFRWSLLCGA